MIKRVLISLLGVFPLLAASQVQQGNVRTLERPAIASVPLPGVTLRASGDHSAVITDETGRFALTLPGLKSGEAYSLQQVRKEGYELVDPGTIGRRYAYSGSSPLSIIMVSTSQLQVEKQRIEDNAYRVAEENYKTRLAGLEAAKKSNEITIEEYRAEIEKLYTSFEKYQSLISSLSDHYARVDYSQLTELEREINICIENGELERADSLLQLAFNPAEFIAGLDSRIAQAEEIINEANADLAAVLKQQEKDAEYLYHLYTISLARFDNEKARFYIETRAALDTTNIMWQEEAADFLMEYASDFETALMYTGRELESAIATYGENSYQAARAYFQIAQVYLFTNDVKELKKAIGYYNKFIDIISSLENSEVIETEFYISALIGGANLFYLQLFFDEAEDILNTAFEAFRSASDAPPFLEAYLWGHLGSVYMANKKYPEALDANRKAVEIAEKCGLENKPAYIIFLSNYGRICYYRGYYDEALALLEKSIEKSFEIFGVVHPYSLDAYSTMSSVYSRKREHGKAYECSLKALEYTIETYGEGYSQLGLLYSNLYNDCKRIGDTNQAGYYMKKAEEVYYNNLVQCLDEGLIMNALRNYENAVRQLGVENIPSFIEKAYEIGIIYETLERADDAKKHYDAMLELMVKNGKQNTPQFALCCEQNGYIKKRNGNHSSAYYDFLYSYEYYSKVEKLEDRAALMAYEIAYQLYQMKKYEQALEYINNAYAFYIKSPFEYGKIASDVIDLKKLVEIKIKKQE